MYLKNKYAHRIPFASNIEDILKEISEELGYSIITIRDIIDIQFKMLDKVVRENGKVKENSKLEDYKSLRLAEFGSFRLSKEKFSRVKNARIKKN